MTRAIWLDENNSPRSDLKTRFGITDVFRSVRDGRTTLTHLEEDRRRFGGAGLYLCSQGDGWPSADTTTPKAWAKWAYEQVQTIAPGSSGDFPKVLLNCETHDAAWVVSMLKAWRSHSPRRVTAWSPEGRQTGIFSPAHVAAINQTGVTVVPQLYGGDMTAHPEGTVILPMLRAGFNPKTLTGFYDAQNLPWDWSGFAFSQGRLPS